MKKIFLSSAILVGMLFLATSFASAYTMWNIDEQDEVEVTAYNNNFGDEVHGAGMFTVKAYEHGTSNDVIFHSWCAEKLVHLDTDTKYTIQSLYDPDPHSAWLLTKFYKNDWNLSQTSEQAQFQRALWYFDDKTNYDASYYSNDLTDYISLAEDAIDMGWVNHNYIKIANLDHNGTAVQDIYIPNNPVPEPATMVLFGIGLLGLGALGRKKQI